MIACRRWSASAVSTARQPHDVASAAAFLHSAHASWLNGVTLDISGGRIII